MPLCSFFGNTVVYLVSSSVLNGVWVLIILWWCVWDDLGGGVSALFSINVCALALRKDVFVLAWLSVGKCVCLETTIDCLAS